MTRLDRDPIKEAAIEQAEQLFRDACGEPQNAHSSAWRARKSSALVMQMHGVERGHWFDHKSGQGGDILDFIAVQFCGLSRARDDFPRVLEEAAARLGVPADVRTTPVHAKARADKWRAESAWHNQQKETKNDRRIRALLAKSKRIPGTPAETYLSGRGINVLPSGLSYLAPSPGLPVPHSDVASLVAWATDENGQRKGGQRILICADGSPAKLHPRKPAFGRIAGFPCRFPGRLPSRPDAPLVVCEGVETALAVWVATGFEVWAVFGVSGFKRTPLPTGRNVVLCPDQDAPDSPAAKAFDRACQEHRARGVDLWIAPAPEKEGSKRDLNDTLLRAGKTAVAEAVRNAFPFVPRTQSGRFTGPGAFATSLPVSGPTFMDLQQVRAEIRREIECFLERCAKWEQEGKNGAAPVLAIAATPGTGKSRIVREVLAEFDLTRLGGDVVYHALTLGLAEEAACHAEELGVGSHVTRGRGAKAPGSDDNMCMRSDFAAFLAELKLPVGPAICRRTASTGATENLCPYAEGCKYLNQWAILPDTPQLRFQSSQYLTLPTDPSGRPIGLRVIDESVWQKFTHQADIPVDVWTRPRHPKQRRGKRDVALAVDATKAASEVLDALQKGESPVLTDYSPNDFARFAGAEQPQSIHVMKPSDSDTNLASALERLEPSFPNARALSQVWEILSDCQARGLATTERLQLVRGRANPETGEARDVLCVTWFEAPPRDRPVLLLDADITPEVLERLYPGAELKRFDVKPNAEVLQVTDRTFSNATLQTQETRQELIDLVRSEVYRDRLNGGKGVLVIATRKCVKAIFEDAGHSFEAMSAASISEFMRETELHGARWLWFGPASLGRNDWKDFGTAIVIGREELPLDALENKARGLFGDTGDKLKFVQGNEQGHRLMDEVELPYLMADGAGQAVMARAHPDRRIRALQMQLRENASEQAIHRLRLVNASEPKRILIACKVPLPGIPVSKLETWDELKPSRILKAISEAALRGGVLRLSAAGLAADAPETFSSERAAEIWLRRGGREEIKHRRASNIIITGASALNPALVSIRLKGQRGRETEALVLLPGRPRDLCERHLGELASFKIIDPVEEP